MPGMFDAALFRKSLGVGVEKMWLSYGTVAEDSPDAHSVRFKDADGNALPEGVLITVTLHPSEITVVCRVANSCAGVGEAEWTPMLQGDEVVVAIPEGDTHAGCVIIGRCNNELDAFPLVVAGQDVSTNTFAFRRSRTPFILETASSYLVHSAVTGAQFGIDQTGQFIMNDGDGSSFFFGADALGMTSADGTTSMQIAVADQQVILTAGSTASFLLDASASQFASLGTLSLGTSGTLALQHAVTAEQVVAFMLNILAQLATTGSFTAGPLAPASYGLAPPGSCQSAVASIVGPALTAMGGLAPLGPAPGGEFLEFYSSTPPIFGSVGALTAAMSNLFAAGDVTGAILGFARPGFMY